MWDTRRIVYSGLSHGGGEAGCFAGQAAQLWLIIGQSTVLLHFQRLDCLLQKHETSPLLSRQILQTVITKARVHADHTLTAPSTVQTDQGFHGNATWPRVTFRHRTVAGTGGRDLGF